MALQSSLLPSESPLVTMAQGSGSTEFLKRKARHAVGNGFAIARTLRPPNPKNETARRLARGGGFFQQGDRPLDNLAKLLVELVG